MPKANHTPAPEAGKEKGHTADNRAAQTNHGTNDTTPDGAHIRDIDPVRGWFSLAAGAIKESRNRPAKRGWNRRPK
jgi:hypothetical protein